MVIAGDMGKEAELFKAAQTGNNALLERVFASYLKKNSGGGGGHGFGRCVCGCVRTFGCVSDLGRCESSSTMLQKPLYLQT